MAGTKRGIDIPAPLLREAMKTEWFETLHSGSALAAALPDHLRSALAVATAERAADSSRAAQETARKNAADRLQREQADRRLEEETRRRREQEARLAEEARNRAQTLRVFVFLAVLILSLWLGTTAGGVVLGLFLGATIFIGGGSFWLWMAKPFRRQNRVH